MTVHTVTFCRVVDEVPTAKLQEDLGVETRAKRVAGFLEKLQAVVVCGERNSKLELVDIFLPQIIRAHHGRERLSVFPRPLVYR